MPKLADVKPRNWWRSSVSATQLDFQPGNYCPVISVELHTSIFCNSAVISTRNLTRKWSSSFQVWPSFWIPGYMVDVFPLEPCSSREPTPRQKSISFLELSLADCFQMVPGCVESPQCWYWEANWNHLQISLQNLSSCCSRLALGSHKNVSLLTSSASLKGA